MKNALLILLLATSGLLVAQKKLKPLYGFYLNNGVAQVDQRIDHPSVKHVNALSYYLSLGLQKNIDSIFMIYGGLRYGRENTRLILSDDQRDPRYFYHYTNRNLALVIAPGIRLNKRQTLFLTLALCRVYQSNTGGSGSRRGFLRNYDYDYGANLQFNAWDFRPGLKWQLKPSPQKNFAFEIGAEPSLLQRKVEIKIRSAYNTLPAKVYYVNYNLVMFYAGFRF